MQAQLDIDDGLETIQAMAQLGDIAALVGREGIGAPEVDQEEVVLLQVVAKRLLRQSAGGKLTHEVMLDIGAPVILAGGGQVAEAIAHGLLRS